MSGCVCVCVCVCVRARWTFKPLWLINGLKYRVEIWYSREAITLFHSWRFSCKLMPKLKLYGILNLLKNVCGSFTFRKILTIVLKLHTNIIYRSRNFGIKFCQNRLKRSNFLRFSNFLKIFSKLSNLCKFRVIELKSYALSNTKYE